jgi:hypothetical protein
MVLLQLAALVACGERTAAIFAAVVIGFQGVRRVLLGLTGGRVGRLRAACFAVAAPLVIVVLFCLAIAGTFDAFVSRFQSDGGSAMARIQMFAILAHLPLRNILIAPDLDMVESMRHAYGLALGIENPIVRFILYDGLLVAAILSFGLVCLLRAVARRLRPGYGWSFLYFLVVIMSYESIGTKTTVLAKFAILMVVAFRPFPFDHGIRGNGGNGARPVRRFSGVSRRPQPPNRTARTLGCLPVSSHRPLPFRANSTALGRSAIWGAPAPESMSSIPAASRRAWRRGNPSGARRPLLTMVPWLNSCRCCGTVSAFRRSLSARASRRC